MRFLNDHIWYGMNLMFLRPDLISSVTESNSFEAFFSCSGEMGRSRALPPSTELKATFLSSTEIENPSISLYERTGMHLLAHLPLKNRRWASSNLRSP